MARQIKRNTGKKTKKTAANGVAHMQKRLVRKLLVKE